jgi:hypothetical protein
MTISIIFLFSPEAKVAREPPVIGKVVVSDPAVDSYVNSEVGPNDPP